MAPLGLIGEIYLVSTGVGCVYLVIGALIGQSHSVSGHVAGHLGHSGLAGHVGHSGVAGHGGHGGIAGHTGAAGHIGQAGAAGHSAAGGHAGTGAHAVGHSASSGQANAPSHQAEPLTHKIHIHPDAHTHDHGLPVLHGSSRERSAIIKLVFRVLNPFSIAAFLAFFGITGLFCQIAFPALGALSLIPAVAIGWVLARQCLLALSWLSSRMFVTDVADADQIIGQMAEVCLPILSGGIGEVTYEIGQTHFNSPARSAKPDSTFERGAKVIICDRRENIVYVEPWNELLLETSVYDSDSS